MQKSVERLKKQDETGLYGLTPKLIERIVSEVHSALDSCFVPSNDPEEMLRHRETLHHQEGIEEVTEKLVKQYGEIYRPLILQESRAHVAEDMGYVPKKADYRDKNFWPKWRAQNETQCSWL